MVAVSLGSAARAAAKGSDVLLMMGSFVPVLGQSHDRPWRDWRISSRDEFTELLKR
jgi:hypothetical protein